MSPKASTKAFLVLFVSAMIVCLINSVLCPQVELLKMAARGKGGGTRKAAEQSTDNSTNLAEHVVISEVYYNPEVTGDSGSEFVEFYNPTGSPVVIGNWSFSDDGGGSWLKFADELENPESAEIPAHGFFLLVDTNWSEKKDVSDWPSGDLATDISLNNSESTLKLRDSEENVVDEVTYAGDADDGESVERKADGDSDKASMRDSDSDKGNAYDTDSFEEDFVGPMVPEPQNTESPPEVYGSNENEAPVADPGGPYECRKGETVTLVGTGSSDPDGTIESFTWDFTDDGDYGDKAGAKPDYTCGELGSHSIGLKVEDDSGLTDTGRTEVTVKSDPGISVSDHSGVADGNDEITVSITGAVEGTDITLTTEHGSLSNTSGQISSSGTFQSTLTAPNEPAPSIVRAQIGEKVVATTVYFLPAESPEIKGVETSIVGPDEGSINISVNEQVDGTFKVKESGASEERASAALAVYGGNPKEDSKIDENSGIFLNVHSDKPTELEEARLEIELSPWPDTPIINFWDSGDEEWKSFSEALMDEENGRIQVTLDSDSVPTISDLSGLIVAAGEKEADESQETTQHEIELSEPGWNMVETPLLPDDPSPLIVFEGVDSAYINHWDPAKNDGDGGYVTPDSGYELELHKGNWIYLEESQVPKTFTFTGRKVEEGEIIFSEPGWHQVGIPGDRGPNSLGVRREKSGKLFTMERAIEELDLLSRYIWTWKPSKAAYHAYEIGSNNEEFEAGDAYWILTKQPDIRLVFPFYSPPGTPDGETQAAGIPMDSELVPEEDIPTPPPPPDFDSGGELEFFASPNPITRSDEVEFGVSGARVDSILVRVSNSAGNLIWGSGFRPGELVAWNMKTPDGSRVSNGLYIYQVSAKRASGEIAKETGKLIVLK